jgi:AraC-like DNA-binding protein
MPMIHPLMIADAMRNADLAGSCAPQQTAIVSLTVFCARHPAKLVPALFEPRFYLLLQGAKRMVIAGNDFLMRPGDGAISTLGLPFHTEVIEALPSTPYLGVAFSLDPMLVSDILLAHPDPIDQNGSAFASGIAADDVVEPVARLLALLRSPADIPALAPLFERELTYRLARGPMGNTLRRAMPGHARFAQVRAATDWIRAHADEPMRVEALARRVGMSVTSLHRHFRAVTGTSPLAYQRHLRLLAARERIVSNSHSVTAAAFAGGYASASQFSREYTRMFGVAPRRDRAGQVRSG